MSQSTPAPDNEEDGGIVTKPMRLKIMYTFDDQNKTNFMARGREVLQVRTVAMEHAWIGVIELKLCLDAIMEASPELLPRFGKDYTVYAYDYSEYDNPLVGQGLLSKSLAAAPPTNDPAEQSEQLITGTVCSNKMGIFGKGIKETLEVKLRLVPVPSSHQGEYLGTAERSNCGTPSAHEQQEWNSYLQSNHNGSQRGSSSGPPQQSKPLSRTGTSMEIVNQLLSPAIQSQANNPFHQAFNQATEYVSEGSNLSAAATKPSEPSPRSSLKRPRGRITKPKTAAKGPAKPRKNAKKVITTASTHGGNTSGYEEGTDGDDGPPSRKRAKTMQTDWNRKSQFGSASDSLRVTASVAGSIRTFRPILASPAPPGIGGAYLQEGPRAPTPVPQARPVLVPRQRNSHEPSVSSQAAYGHPLRNSPGLVPQSAISESGRQSNEDSVSRPAFSPPSQQNSPEPSQRRMSVLSQADTPRMLENSYVNLDHEASQDEVRFSIESANPSPERNDSPAETYQDIASSPPILRGISMRSSPPCPSSPELPQMPRMDSGFMSGEMDDIFGENDDNDEFMVDIEAENEQTPRQRSTRRRPQKQAKENDASKPKAFSFNEETPGPMELLPTKMPIFQPHKPQPAKATLSRSGSFASVCEEPNLPTLNPATASRMSTPLQTDIAGKNRVEGLANDESTLPSQPVSRPASRQPTPLQIAMPEMQLGQPQQFHSNRLPASSELQAPSLMGMERGSTGSAMPPRVASAPACRPSTEIQPRPVPRKNDRSASLSGLDMPMVPASDPIVPQSGLRREQTWSAVPHAMSEAPEPVNAAMAAYPQMRAPLQRKLDKAIAEGEMPPFCENCGSISTSTWRKAHAQERDGAPEYHEYSEKVGMVTCQNILTRDSEGRPLKHLLIKKTLAYNDKAEDFRVYLLCNPCGLWMSKYHSQRPEGRWENGKPLAKRIRNPPAPRVRKSRARNISSALPSDANYPQSEGNTPQLEPYLQQSEANFPRVDAGQNGAASVGTDGRTGEHTGSVYQPSDNMSSQRPAGPQRQLRATSAAPAKRLNAMTSDAASAALRRAIRSSPARWTGTGASPIELDDEHDGTRRILFPSPDRAASRVLTEVVATNVVQATTDHHLSKDQVLAGREKENLVPSFTEDDDPELMRLFEEAMARPTTPTRKSPAQNLFKTPTRPTPNHRPITRSVSRSARSARNADQLLLLPQASPTKVPGSRSRGTPRHATFESPFTATLNQLLSNNDQSPSRGTEDFQSGLDFSMPDLPPFNSTANVFQPTTYDNEDFFSTDVPMPSSPPRTFTMYEDSAALGSINWGALDDPFAIHDEHGVKQEPGVRERNNDSMTAEQAKDGEAADEEELLL